MFRGVYLNRGTYKSILRRLQINGLKKIVTDFFHSYLLFIQFFRRICSVISIAVCEMIRGYGMHVHVYVC